MTDTALKVRFAVLAVIALCFAMGLCTGTLASIHVLH